MLNNWAGGYPPGVTGKDCDLPDPEFTERQLYEWVKRCIDHIRLDKADAIEAALEDEMVPDDARNDVRTELLAAYERGEI